MTLFLWKCNTAVTAGSNSSNTAGSNSSNTAFAAVTANFQLVFKCCSHIISVTHS